MWQGSVNVAHLFNRLPWRLPSYRCCGGVRRSPRARHHLPCRVCGRPRGGDRGGPVPCHCVLVAVPVRGGGPLRGPGHAAFSGGRCAHAGLGWGRGAGLRCQFALSCGERVQSRSALRSDKGRLTSNLPRCCSLLSRRSPLGNPTRWPLSWFVRWRALETPNPKPQALFRRASACARHTDQCAVCVAGDACSASSV